MKVKRLGGQQSKIKKIKKLIKLLNNTNRINTSLLIFFLMDNNI